MERRTILLVSGAVVSASLELWNTYQLESGMPAETLIAFPDRHKLKAATAQVKEHGETAFLFHCAQQGRRWAGHLERLQSRGSGHCNRGESLVWTWEAVPTVCASFSHRQLCVLAEFAHGRIAKQIAGKLGISTSTVRTHLLRCRLAVRCSDQTCLRNWAKKHSRVLSLLANGQYGQ